ncbi:Polyketide synthase [Pyrenophora tritici-repentis]|nr:Polyketide synthase [Pyrenophora tritici-repentis]
MHFRDPVYPHSTPPQLHPTNAQPPRGNDAPGAQQLHKGHLDGGAEGLRERRLADFASFLILVKLFQ